MVFAIDRAGIVGADGETHQGIFDLSYLSCIPNLTILAPKNKWELSDMLKYAVKLGHPVAIRYPRGEAYDGLKEYRDPIVTGKAEVIYREKEILLLAVGSMVRTGEKVRDMLKEDGFSCSLVNVRFVRPFDTDLLDELAADHPLIVTMEENVQSGGFGEHVQAYCDSAHRDLTVLNISIPDRFVPHGRPDELAADLGLDPETIADRIRHTLEEMEIAGEEE